MSRTIFFMVSSFVLAAASLHAQTLAGTWQGTLPVAASGQGAAAGGSGPRVVFTIKKDSDGSYHGGVTFIDRGGALPLSSVTVLAADVTFAQSTAGINYRGKLSGDGASIAGTWAQGDRSFPLTLQLAAGDAVWKREGPAALPPMAANADPSFEVATIKPANPDQAHANFDLRARQFNATGMSVKELIKIAYNVRGRQVLGGPAGIDDKKYDIAAEPDAPGVPSEVQNRAMVHKLLTERFHLVSHTEQQVFPVMALTLDPKGPRPTASDPDFSGNGGMFGRRDGDDIVLQFSGTTIAQFLGFIMNTFQDKQLVDETGLTGVYDITLRLAGVTQGQVSDADEGNALVLAAQHAGFKLVSKKEPLPVVVVDHIEPPTAN